MKVEFELEEVRSMLDVVVDSLLEEKFGKRDTAAIRRWRSNEMVSTSSAMRGLVDKVNDDLLREHQAAERSPIQKPDWA